MVTIRFVGQFAWNRHCDAFVRFICLTRTAGEWIRLITQECRYGSLFEAEVNDLTGCRGASKAMPDEKTGGAARAGGYSVGL